MCPAVPSFQQALWAMSAVPDPEAAWRCLMGGVHRCDALWLPGGASS